MSEAADTAAPGADWGALFDEAPPPAAAAESQPPQHGVRGRPDRRAVATASRGDQPKLLK